MKFSEILDKKRLVICCGSGGVGKTTTSAAIALEAAKYGKKTLVITIDPARRLADSLGLKSLDNSEQAVSQERLIEAGLPKDAQLYASMLDTALSLNDLMHRITSSKEQAERIINNAVYRQFSLALAGSEEYVAMERLYDLIYSSDYDFIVLDTPPAKNALDFLNAPNRLATFLDESVVKWFVKPAKQSLKSVIFQKGGAVAFKFLGILVGKEFITDLVDFFQAFNGLYAGFKERAEKVNHLLRDKQTIFVLVTSPERNTISEAIHFSNTLTKAGIPLEAVVINRAYQLIGDEKPNISKLESLLESDEFIGNIVDINFVADSKKLFEKFLELYEMSVKLNEIAQDNIEYLLEVLKGNQQVARIPVFGDEIHDINGLMLMNNYLFTRR